jgi:tetraacyldisaccharide 4'-kinase
MNVWGNPVLSRLLIPFSWLYALAMAVRNLLYDRGLLAVHRVPAKVVSVGNLTVGGTGKTPLAETLVRFFADAGMKPAVVSRGYGRKGKSVLIVSDGRVLHNNPEMTGDEPLLLAKRLGNVPVVVGADRVAAARRACERFRCDVIVLDDAFQHRRLARDLDVVVLRAAEPFGNGRVLPAGPLREPMRGLKRSHVIVLTGEQGEGTTAWDAGKTLRGFYRPLEWQSLTDGSVHPLEFMRQRSMLVFSGIGNPGAFEATLLGLGVKPVGHMTFKDHHRYTRRDMDRIAAMAETHGAVAVATTEKDGIRIRHAWKGKVPLLALRIELEVEGGKERLREVLGSIF